MRDREKTRPTTAEEWKSHILEFARGCEFGSAEFNAVNDFRNLQTLYGKAGVSGSDALIDRVSGKASLSVSDDKFIKLQRIVALEHTIEQKGANVPGYGSAYMEVMSSFEEILQTAYNEAKTSFSDEKNEQYMYVKEIYENTLGNLTDAVIEEEIRDKTNQQQ